MIGTKAAGRKLSWFFAICPEQRGHAADEETAS